MISLGVGKMEIDWGKNNVFTDHSVLFKVDDVGKAPYFYSDDSASEEGIPVIVEYKEGLTRSLASMKTRLDLLGYGNIKTEMSFANTAREQSPARQEPARPDSEDGIRKAMIKLRYGNTNTY